MPRIARTVEKVDSIKERFVDTAVVLLTQHGYEGFSIRQLARELGIAAATLYNYFPGGKDELYLLVAARGYEHLYEQFVQASQSDRSPWEKVSALATAYLEFALEQPHYYNLLFNSDAPKYSDYVGKKLQPVAEVQNDAAMRVAGFASQILAKATGEKDGAEVAFRLLQLWSMLHGIASLKNSRVTLEVIHLSPQIIDRYVKESLRSFMPDAEVKK